ncbi:hypothetical protein niasHT_015090 [Heterodera trifolii]|uniref:Uncharacterized protein n=1 Tax=Heterodera trifolii TaxID=157864 RepID=A0ABD2L9I1_9BILA
MFLLFNHCLFFALTGGNASIEDDAMVELAKGPEYFNKFCAEKGLIINEKNQFLYDQYGAHLGLLYAMRMEWNYIKKTEVSKFAV